MNIFENKAYRLLWLDEESQLTIIKSNGLINVYKRYEDEKGICHDSLWLEEGYKDIKLLLKNEHHSENKYCYLQLTDENGTHSIMEVVNKVPILDEYQFNHYKIDVSWGRFF